MDEESKTAPEYEEAKLHWDIKEEMSEWHRTKQEEMSVNEVHVQMDFGCITLKKT